MSTLSELSFLVAVAAIAIPATFAFAGVLSPRRIGAATTLATALAVLVAFGAAAEQSAPTPAGASLGVRIDAVTRVMVVLVAGLGAIVARYSRRYLQGDAGLLRYQRWLLLTLCAVTTLVIAQNLLVIALGWTATSIALHQLLTFYDRPAALIAAHKKFLVSRLADVCLLGCLALVHSQVGSLDLDRIASWAADHPELTLSMQMAAVLLVVTVALKSAQLPFHGWLTQVMEAPTPVSALLHAGVVNVGGFVLIRLSPWLARAEVAALLLVVIGLASAIVGALVMTTRVSVKVALAWSTCAQMGFLLVQCGLGLWHLALLHLVAHSVYKAHAFLSTGDAVDQWRLRAMTPAATAPSPVRLGAVALGATLAALVVVEVSSRFVAGSEVAEPSSRLLAVMVALSMAPLLVRATTGNTSLVGIGLRTALVVLLYAVWHAIAAQSIPLLATPSSVVGCVLAGLGFVTLFVVKAALLMRPNGRFARALYPWLFAGLYLDERFTRLTFRVWPARLQPRARPAPPLRNHETLEART